MQDYIYNIGSFFSKVAAENSDRTALKYPDGEKVTYAELESLSNKIAHFFLEQGLKTGDVIAIFNNKSPLGYACMLAALKAGIIYTNLDLTSPYQRIKKIIERCKPGLLLFDMACDLKEAVSELEIETIDLYDNFAARINAHKASVPSATAAVTGADAAYIMFTSGSTGFPERALCRSHMLTCSILLHGDKANSGSARTI